MSLPSQQAPTREALLQLYRQLLRNCQRYPSKNRMRIYEAIRVEWRDHVSTTDEIVLHRQWQVAYKGLQQLQQYSEHSMSGGQTNSPNWSITLEQNPMPKPSNYEQQGSNSQNRDQMTSSESSDSANKS